MNTMPRVERRMRIMTFRNSQTFSPVNLDDDEAYWNAVDGLVFRNELLKRIPADVLWAVSNRLPIEQYELNVLDEVTDRVEGL